MVHFPVISFVCSDIKYDVFHCSVTLQVMTNGEYMLSIFFSSHNSLCKISFKIKSSEYLIECGRFPNVVLS